MPRKNPKPEAVEIENENTEFQKDIDQYVNHTRLRGRVLKKLISNLQDNEKKKNEKKLTAYSKKEKAITAKTKKPKS
jgi:hypothetical protein